MKIFYIICLLSLASCNSAIKKEKIKIIDAPKEEVVFVETEINYKDPVKMFFVIAGTVVLVPVLVKLLSKN